MPTPPDINKLPITKPDLSHVPPEVAARIEDSWRVGGILSQYVFEELDLRAVQKDCADSRGLHSRHLVAMMGPTPANPVQLREEMISLQFKQPRREYSDEELESSYVVSPRVSAKHSTCNRLAAESELLFFRMAIELDSKLRGVLDGYPLLDCLRRLRNSVAHHEPLVVAREDFSLNLSVETDPSAVVATTHSKEEWFLSVTESDLNQSLPKNNPVDPVVAKWFIKQCDRWPLHYLLVAATEELRKFYAPSP